MSDNRFEGAARKIGGKIEGGIGDLTGDSEMQAEGANLPARREPVDDPFL